MVCGLGEAKLQSAELDLWAGVEPVVFLDGRGRLAGLATAWVRWSQGCVSGVSGSAGCERGLVGAVLWDAFASDGVRLDLFAVVVDCCHDWFVLEEIAAGRGLAGSLFGLGFVCQRVEFYDLAIELRSVGQAVPEFTLG